jgi:hypothetical protein
MLLLVCSVMWEALSEYKVPIVFLYTIVPRVCEHGIQDYIKIALLQAVVSQPNAEIVFATNLGECETLAQSLESIPSLKLVDTTALASNATKYFAEQAKEMFQSDGKGELWITSALRFFQLEDLMISQGYKEMLHAEADNLLYGNLTALLPTLREQYVGMAAQPLTDKKSLFTASVLWVSSLEALQKFNAYMTSLAHMDLTPQGMWKKYLVWLRFFACCKPGGVDQDAAGNGIRPFAVNEMSMMAYYHEIAPNDLHAFPIVPKFKYFRNRYVGNMSEYGPGGKLVGPPTGKGIWDPNSWGQYMGGTSDKKGRNSGFTDGTHVIGQAIRLNPSCQAKMVCGNAAFSAEFNLEIVKNYATEFHHKLAKDEQLLIRDMTPSMKCVTAPFVRCSENDTWVPLWNLHVHSKRTADFRSLPCICEDAPRETSKLPSLDVV